ncbi:replication initiation negative regulator SeqA [Colwelliaceae bacterium BS250]
MKSIEVDEQLYQYIASNTKYIGESASAILRRLLVIDQAMPVVNETDKKDTEKVTTPSPKSSKVEKAEKAVANKKTITAKAPVVTGDVVDAVVDQTLSMTSCQSIFDVINKEELAMQRGAVGRFLLILSNLNRVHPNQFAAILDIRGRDRLYFANSESDLLENGSSTKPKQIPESNYWVMTNSNTTRKKLMLTDVANVLGYTSEEAEIIRDFL